MIPGSDLFIVIDKSKYGRIVTLNVYNVFFLLLLFFENMPLNFLCLEIVLMRMPELS